MSKLDQVMLVNEQDEVIGSMDKVEAHRGDGKLHRAISVYLFRLSLERRKSSSTEGEPDKRRVELLIQQRSLKKIVGADMWANTVCGNVQPNESYEECAYHRLKEELGITDVKIKPIYKFRYQVQCNPDFSENEMDQVFVGWYEGEVKPNPDEVQDYAWVNWDELKSKTDQLTFAPWFILMLDDEKLIQQLQIFIKK